MAGFAALRCPYVSAGSLVVGGNKVGDGFLNFFQAWLVFDYDGFVVVEQIEQRHGGEVVGGFFVDALGVVPAIVNKCRE